MFLHRLDGSPLPVLTVDRSSKILGFAHTVAQARELAGIWAAAHGLHLLGLVCSRRFTLDTDPAVNAQPALSRAGQARHAWIALLDD